MFGKSFNLSTLTGKNGFMALGPLASGNLGSSVNTGT